MKYQFLVLDDNDDIIFEAHKPTVEMLEEEIGRFERHIKSQHE